MAVLDTEDLVERIAALELRESQADSALALLIETKTSELRAELLAEIDQRAQHNSDRVFSVVQMLGIALVVQVISLVVHLHK